MSNYEATNAFPDELLRQLRSGDDAAWARFYDEIAGDVRAYVARIGASNPDDALGETMVQVVRSLPSFRGSAADLRPWTFRIARNRVIDEGRRRSRRPTLTELDERNDPVADDPDAMLPNTMLPNTILQGEVPEMLNGLTSDQRDAVWLRYVVDLSLEEAAEVMQKSPEAIAALTHRALRRLRTGLGVK